MITEDQLYKLRKEEIKSCPDPYCNPDVGKGSYIQSSLGLLFALVGAVLSASIWIYLKTGQIGRFRAARINPTARFLSLVVLPFIFVGLILMAVQFPVYSDPKVAASAYVWPSGCPKSKIETGSIVPSACADGRFALPRSFTTKNGFHSLGRGPHTFYRMENDTVALDCGGLISGCAVGSIYKGVFFVPVR